MKFLKMIKIDIRAAIEKLYRMDKMNGPWFKYKPITKIHFISPAPIAPIAKKGKNKSKAATAWNMISLMLSVVKIPTAMPIKINQFGIFPFFISVKTDINKNIYKKITILSTSHGNSQLNLYPNPKIK